MTARPCRECGTATCSHTTLCWEHRGAPTVTRDGNRISIGTPEAMILTTTAARDLALAIADTLTEDQP